MTELERVIIGLTIFQKYKNPDIFGPIIIMADEEKTQWEMYV